jgi:acetylornithine deacetylase/succinyl-diaminopimelate desuccinylase-like protein
VVALTMSAAGREAAEIELLSSLVSIKSHSGEEAAVQAFIVRWFESRGIESRLEPAPDGLSNVVVEVAGSGAGPTLWIGGHCDTVRPAAGWTTDPYRPTIDGNRLYGLGAMDMKGGLAAAMLVVADLAERRESWPGTLIFAALADEEAYSRGAKAFLQKGRTIDAALMCEPHFDDPITGAIGKVNLNVTVRGRSAHGSRPAEGVNAVVEAAKLIAAIDGLERYRHPRFGSATHCVLRASGGQGEYAILVPDFAEFLVNWHLVPGESSQDAVAAIEGLIARLHSPAEFQVTLREPCYESFELAEDLPMLAIFSEAYRRGVGKAPVWSFGSGVSDANLFNAQGGIPTLLFGPGGRNLHSADEWVDLDQLVAARAIIREFCLGFFRGPVKRKL